MNQKQFDNFGKTFAKYVSLNILGMLGMSCYILADTIFVARGIGTDGLTALNLALPIFSVIYGIGQMLAMGSATKYSILRAMGDERKANRFFTQAFWTTIFIGLFFCWQECSFQVRSVSFSDPAERLSTIPINI